MTLRQICGFQLRNGKDDTKIERLETFCGCLKNEFQNDYIFYLQRYILNLKKMINFHTRNQNTILKQLYKKAAMQNKREIF